MRSRSHFVLSDGSPFSQILSKKLNCVNITAVGKFSDGETHVRISHEKIEPWQSIAKELDMVVTCKFDSNGSIMETMLLLDAVQRAEKGRKVFLVLPYIAYSRQDMPLPGEPTSISVIAKMLNMFRLDAIVTVEMHNPTTISLFKDKFYNIDCKKFLANEIARHIDDDIEQSDNLCLVSPDLGGLKRVNILAKHLIDSSEKVDLPVVGINKYRSAAEKVEIMGISGDVKGKVCYIVDDIVNTGKTLVEATRHLKSQGARSVKAFVVHATSIFNRDLLEGELDDLYIAAEKFSYTDEIVKLLHNISSKV